MMTDQTIHSSSRQTGAHMTPAFAGHRCQRPPSYARSPWLPSGQDQHFRSARRRRKRRRRGKGGITQEEKAQDVAASAAAARRVQHHLRLQDDGTKEQVKSQNECSFLSSQHGFGAKIKNKGSFFLNTSTSTYYAARVHCPSRNRRFIYCDKFNLEANLKGPS